jgi:rhamnulokinase
MSETEKRMIAVDLGASGGKCFAGELRDGSFTMREIHRFPHEGVTFHIPDRTGRLVERAYWDDTLLYRNIVAGLEAYGRQNGGALDSLGIDTWGADGGLMSEDGELIARIYCYRDHRLDDMIAQVKARIDARRIYEITGIHFQPFNLSNQLLWFVTQRRDLLRPRCFYLPIPSVFCFNLGGVRAVDSSWASITQLMDARTRRWSPEILKALGIPRRVLPPIVKPGTVLGELHEPIARAAGVSRAKLIAAAAHDTASAFAAAPIENVEEALIISSGTWSLIGTLVPKPITSDAAMAAGFSNEGGIGNTRFLKNCMGTWLVQELRRVWRAEDGREMPWDEITRLASAAPAFASLVDPDDGGFFNPANMETAIAEFCRRTGQAVPADRGACLRLVYESLALKYRAVNEQICAVSGRSSRTVNIVGGGSRNEMLNRFTADALGLRVLAGPEEATAVGNFMVQAMGLGVIRSMQDAQPIIKQVFPIREYRPQDTASWDRAYERFRRIVA